MAPKRCQIRVLRPSMGASNRCFGVDQAMPEGVVIASGAQVGGTAGQDLAQLATTEIAEFTPNQRRNAREIRVGG